VIQQSLKLAAIYKAKKQALRAHLEKAMQSERYYTDDEVEERIKQRLAQVL
jgi:hypothetical protein